MSSMVTLDTGHSTLDTPGMAAQLNVRDYGAVGDGRADDTRAVQKALYAAAGGQLLYVNPGTYRITDSLLIGSHTTLAGAGAASVLAFEWFDQMNGAAFCLGNRHRKDAERGNAHITIERLVIEGGAAGLPYGEDEHSVTHGISLRKVADVEIGEVEIRHLSGFAICSTGIARALIHSCRIHDVGRDGITSFPLVDESKPSYDNRPLVDLTVAANDLWNVGDDGIAVHAGTAASVNRSHPPSQIVIADNTIHGRIIDHSEAQGRGICLSGAVDASVHRNAIRRTVSTGILVQSWSGRSGEVVRSARVNIARNVLFDPGRSEGLKRAKHGLQLKGADHVDVSHNSIIDAAGRGLDARDVTHVAITKNIVSGSADRYALVVSGDPQPSADVTVAENLLLHHHKPALMMHRVERGVERDNLQTVES